MPVVPKGRPPAQGVAAQGHTRVKNTTRQGFPVFQVPRGARPLTLEDVRSDEDDA